MIYRSIVIGASVCTVAFLSMGCGDEEFNTVLIPVTTADSSEVSESGDVSSISSCNALCISKSNSNCSAKLLCDSSTKYCKDMFWIDAASEVLCVIGKTDCPRHEPVSCEHAELATSPKIVFTSSFRVKGGDADYILLGNLGMGFCNDVRLAYSESLNANVALKCLRYTEHPDCKVASHAAEFARHQQYGRLGIRVPKAFEVFTNQNDRPCIAMELTGKSLKQIRNEDGPIALEQVAEWGLQMIEWAQITHTANLSHTDMHTGNIAIGLDDALFLLDLQSTKEMTDVIRLSLERTDLVFIAYNLLFLYTGNNAYWNVKTNIVARSKIDRNQLIHDGYSGVSDLFSILDHASSGDILNWGWVRLTLMNLTNRDNRQH